VCKRVSGCVRERLTFSKLEEGGSSQFLVLKQRSGLVFDLVPDTHGCAYICVYVCACECMCMYKRVCVCVCMCVYKCQHVYVADRSLTLFLLPICIRACVCVCMCVYMNTYEYIKIYMCVCVCLGVRACLHCHFVFDFVSDTHVCAYMCCVYVCVSKYMYMYECLCVHVCCMCMYIFMC